MDNKWMVIVVAASVVGCAQNTAVIWDEAVLGIKVSANENPAKPVYVKAGYVGETLVVVPPKEPLHSLAELGPVKNVHHGEALALYSDFTGGSTDVTQRVYRVTSNGNQIGAVFSTRTRVEHTLASGTAAVLYAVGKRQ